MKSQLEIIFTKFKNSVSENKLGQIDIETVAWAKNITDHTISELRKCIPAIDLNVEEQIEFHKNIIPEILAFAIEAVLRYQIMNALPNGPREVQIAWMIDEIKQLEHFQNLNSFLHAYFKNGSKKLDFIFFTKECQEEFTAGMPFSYSCDPLIFPQSNIFANFLANERIQQWLTREIELAENRLKPKLEEKGGLKWTGELVNLVELLYGLHLTGQLNHGNLSLNELVRWAESNLGISIGVIQRKFAEIQRRKTISPTRYIEQLKDAIIQKMDDLAS